MGSDLCPVWAMIARSDTSAIAAAVANPTAASAPRIVASPARLPSRSVSDQRHQLLLHHRLIREEPRAAVPGRGIPLVTTDLVLRRLGVGGIGELQQQLLAASPQGQADISREPPR